MIKLSRIDHSDLEQLRAWRNMPEIYDWCRQSTLIDSIQQSEWYKWQASDPRTEMYLITDVEDPKDKEPGIDGAVYKVGVCGLTDIDWINSRAEFSLYIAPASQGIGYATPSLMELLKVGFEDLNLNVIWGETFEDNPARHIFEKIGMKQEGLRRQYYYKKGRYINARLYSLTRDEYLGSDTNELTYIPVPEEV